MKENKLAKALSGFGKGFVAHRPEIMLGVGIGGLVVSAFFIGYETPKFKKLLEEEKQKNDSEKIPMGDLAKTALKCYAAPVTGFIFSSASLGKGLYDVNKKNVALSAASAISEATTKELISKMKNEIGEEKAEKIVESIAKDGVPVKTIVTPTTYFEFEDAFTGVRFEATVKSVEKAFEKTTRHIEMYDFARLNDLYWNIMEGNKRTVIDIPKVADRLGWDINDIYNGELEYNIEPRYYEDEDTVRLILSYNAPSENY